MVAAGRGELNAGSISPAFLSGDSNGAGYLRQLAVLIVPASTGILGADFALFIRVIRVIRGCKMHA